MARTISMTSGSSWNASTDGSCCSCCSGAFDWFQPVSMTPTPHNWQIVYYYKYYHHVGSAISGTFSCSCPHAVENLKNRNVHSPINRLSFSLYDLDGMDGDLYPQR